MIFDVLRHQRLDVSFLLRRFASGSYLHVDELFVPRYTCLLEGNYFWTCGETSPERCFSILKIHGDRQFYG